jgi:hypothetical protein
VKDNQEIITATSIIFNLEDSEINDYAKFRQLLKNEIFRLLKDDYQRLVNNLYRVDLKEILLKKALNAASLEDASEMLTDFVLTRQEEKLSR